MSYSAELEVAFAPSNLDERMGKTSRRETSGDEPTLKLSSSETMVSAPCSATLVSFWYQGIAVFANRRGYRFLLAYFRWLAERAIAEADWDPGDHDHLTPHSCLCDEIDFTFDTLTPSNRKAVLRNAGAKKRSRH